MRMRLNGNGMKMTLREFLGEFYFSELDKAKTLGVIRFVFGFF